MSVPIINRRPQIAPDDVKALTVERAKGVKLATIYCDGAVKVEAEELWPRELNTLQTIASNFFLFYDNAKDLSAENIEPANHLPFLFISVNAQPPKQNAWYIVQHSIEESGYAIAQWLEGGWHNEHIHMPKWDKVRYHPFPLA